MIDPRAVIHEGAKLHPTVKVGPFAVIGPNVEIGEGTEVGAAAIIDGYTTIGSNNRIFPHAAVGLEPQDLKFKGEKTLLTIGDRNVIREFTTMNPGTLGGGGITKVGSDCLFMTYSHVAHDCTVGNHVILANAATLAGHVEVEDYVILGGLSGVHQFSRLGQHCIIGGGSVVVMDVPPYVTAAGNRARLSGLNLVGLKRREFSEEAIKAIRTAYRLLFQGSDTLAKAIEKLKSMEEFTYSEVRTFVEFLEKSQRGVTR
jgi:UDP-N-acetylglucosamine acyltransferase